MYATSRTAARAVARAEVRAAARAAGRAAARPAGRTASRQQHQHHLRHRHGHPCKSTCTEFLPPAYGANRLGTYWSIQHCRALLQQSPPAEQHG